MSNLSTLKIKNVAKYRVDYSLYQPQLSSAECNSVYTGDGNGTRNSIASFSSSQHFKQLQSSSFHLAITNNLKVAYNATLTIASNVQKNIDHIRDIFLVPSK